MPVHTSPEPEISHLALMILAKHAALILIGAVSLLAAARWQLLTGGKPHEP